jgi:ferric-dicitrate binding protein FerR (iron transport regulator)
VWLNSGSVFKYPTSFNGKLREVELTGEAYFDITRDPDHPFIVKTGIVDIEVRGTKFDVINYPDDPQIEVILESGQVRLLNESLENSILLSEPGERGVYDKSLGTTVVKKVDIDKYTLWKNGILIFRDDPMNEVVRKLSHKFNADIKLKSPAINEYVYTATFIDESLIQILELLKMSAPLDYTIMNQKKLDDNSYSRLEIIIDKTNK